MAILTEEVGEVAKIVARKYGEQSLKKEDNIDNLADELSDVLLSLIHISEPTRLRRISYAVFCLKKKKKTKKKKKKTKRKKKKKTRNNKQTY